MRRSPPSLFLGALSGILLAVLLSMLMLLIEANRPRISVLGRRRGTDDFRPLDDHPGDETIEGLRIVRPEGSIYFANADRVHDALLGLVDSSPARVLLIDGRAVPDLEYTALETFRNLRRELDRRGVELWVAALNPRPLAMLEASGAAPGVRSFATLHEAVDAYVALRGSPGRSSGAGEAGLLATSRGSRSSGPPAEKEQQAHDDR